MMEILFSLDIYGVGYNLREKGKTKFHTKFSLIISMITILSSITISILFGKEIFINKLPSVNSGQITVDFNSTKIDYKNFPFMIEITNADTFENLDFEKFFELQTIDYNPDGPYPFKSNITKCDSNVLKDKYIEYFGKFIQTSFCYNVLENFYFSDGNDDKGRFLISRIKKCDINKNKNCEDIFKKYDNVNIFVYYLEPVINSQSYLNVITYRINYIKFRLSKTSYYDTTITLRNDKIITDKGKIFDEQFFENFVAADKIVKDLIPKEETNPLLINLIIMSTNIRTSIERRYMKLQDLFAKIGGIFNALYVIGYIFSYYFTEFHFKFYVYNTIASLLDTDINKKEDLSHLILQDNNIDISANNIDSFKNNKFEDRNKMSIQKMLNNNIRDQYKCNDVEILDLNKNKNENEFLKAKQFNEFVKQLNLTITNVIDVNNNYLKARRKEIVLNNFRTDLNSTDSASTNNFFKFIYKQYLCCNKLNLKENYIFEKALSFEKSILSAYKYSLEEV